MGKKQNAPTRCPLARANFALSRKLEELILFPEEIPSFLPKHRGASKDSDEFAWRLKMCEEGWELDESDLAPAQ